MTEKSYLRSAEYAPDIYLGIMTGTSLDAIDIAACRFIDRSMENWPPVADLLAFHSIEWPTGLRDLLMELAISERVEMDMLARVHFLLAIEYAKAVEGILDKSGIEKYQIRAIGLHGQTVRHLPTPAPAAEGLPSVGATLQLGSGSALAAISGIDVVSDFRAADIALGGQGAPLVPMFDYWFFWSERVNRLVVNIGGIANVTWIEKKASRNNIVAFDSGPGNMLIDSLTRRYFELPFDTGGAIARSGNIKEELVAKLLMHPYFAMPPPKSTGRELFSEQFLDIVHQEIAESKLTPTDSVATLTELTARSIAMSLEWTNAKKKLLEIIVSGGGAMNKFLIERIEAIVPKARVTSTEAFAIPVNAKEAIAFAFFAKAYIEGIPIHLPSTTGASRPATLGSLSRGAA